MVAIMLLANRPAVMGEFTLSPRLLLLGWVATFVTTGMAIALLTALR